ncbi:MAG: CDC48 family AAA ATPase [SAR202 cluster bacterium]|nr:CDC48 family AAA ATPase [SAR202 cluster bacterium]
MIKENSELLTLAATEAMSKDVGRGIARMDPANMATIGVQVGDIVRLVGKRATAAKVMPAYTEDRGQSAIQIDGIIRENAQVSLGQPVQIDGANFSVASAVVLAPVTDSKALVSPSDTKYLARVLEGLPLVQGDRVRATTPFGGRYQEFLVQEATPGGVVVIGPSTVIRVKGEGKTTGKTGITYEDIGGLRKEVHKIREMIELPLKHPELFERLGIEAPKGVLLLGPPGCGKTLIARAVANETDASFFTISGPEVIHKFYGESEAHLRAIFDKASQNAPAIVFIDEIDAIASKREEVRGDQQVEKRVVAQLLALMDGLKSRGEVVVIGATNIPDTLDPALRRPGRFDREIDISVPDKHGRLEILQIHTRGMPLASDPSAGSGQAVHLERLAEITHGFVGADLEALCREAAMTTLRKVMPHLQLDADYVPYDLVSELEITMDDFLEAFKDVEPSAMREVFTEIPDVGWADVGGLEEVKQVLMETIEWPFQYPDLFRQAGTTPPKGVLLTGAPGTGKTLLAKAVASQSGVNFISVKGPALLSKWVGESEKGIREVFKKAKQASPCIVFFDELDALIPIRGSGDSQVTDRVVSQMLTELDGIEELKGVTVLAATNRRDIIDPALLRAGRFDIQIELPAPDGEARKSIFKIHTRDAPLAGDVDLELLASATSGLVGSQIEGICRKASMLAIREYVKRHHPDDLSADVAALEVTPEHFQQAIKEVCGGPA